jgi:hypothetical protein
MKNRVGPLILVGVLAMTCSCVMLQSQHQNVTEKVQEPNVMGYFLPKGLIHVQFKPKEGSTTGEYELTITTEYVPDPNFFYTLKYQPSAISNDTINKVAVSQQGLLTHVQVSAEDKTADIINKLVLIAKAPFVPSIPVPGAALTALTKEGTPKKLLAFDMVIDPTPPPSPPPLRRPNSIEEANAKLKDYKIQLSLINWEGQRTVIPSASPLDPSQGVYYRPLLPWTLRVESTDNNLFIKDATIYLPNGAPILSLDITRAAFVTKSIHYTFTDGILTQLEISKPSEVLGFVDIPLNVIKAIVALPTELIQVKIDTSKMNQGLLAQQLAEIRARDALIDYLNKRGGQPGGK